MIFESSLNRAILQVRQEMRALGLWLHELDHLEIRHGWFSVALGYQWYGDRTGGRMVGDVVISRYSLGRLWEHFKGGKRTSLRDLLRHEIAHAFADLHGGWYRCRAFSVAFGRPHDANFSAASHREKHVSAYAATSPCEDFAETFMMYVRHKACCRRTSTVRPSAGSGSSSTDCAAVEAVSKR